MSGRMKRIAVVALAVASLVGAACGDDGGSTGPTTTVSAATLQAKLLAVGDLGTGWQVGPAVNEADLGDAIQFPCEDMGLNPTIAARLLPVTGIQFEPTDRSAAQLIEFAMVGDATRLAADLKIYFDGLDECANTTIPGATSGAVGALTIPNLGDQRAAFAARAQVPPGSTTTWYVRTAVVRVGGTAVQISLTEILSTAQEQPRVSDAAFVTLLQTAVARLRS